MPSINTLRYQVHRDKSGEFIEIERSKWLKVVYMESKSRK